jgi:ATP-dependent Clp protease ATP-binding subunit ClpA
VPFINDQFDFNNEQITKTRQQQQVTRTSRFKFKPEAVMAALQTRIVGQQAVLDSMRAMLYTLKADFADKHKPLSVILFLGPTGVGKTETVRVLAESILGNADRLCRIDMNTLAQEHYTAALTGSPPGYIGSKEGQTLFDVEKIKGSFSKPGIVLFDEIEKANQSVLRSLMNVLDTGKLSLTSGVGEIDFTNTLIFMTSNLGAKELSATKKRFSRGWRALLRLTPPSQKALLDQAMNTQFDPEFINRIEQVLTFDWLGESTTELLVDLELDKLNKRLHQRYTSVEINAEVRKYLSEAYDARYGARDIARRIRTELEPRLAESMLKEPEQYEFEAEMNAGKLSFRTRHSLNNVS